MSTPATPRETFEASFSPSLSAIEAERYRQEAQVSALVSIAESLQEIKRQLNLWSEGGRLDVLIHNANKLQC